MADFEEDDEKERRMRALLAPDISSVMGEDPEEEGEGTVKPTNAKLTPAQQHYSEIIGQPPQAQDYKPSGWRRFAAALAGGLTGARDPRLGIEVAGDIANAPFHRALTNWQRAVEGAKTQMGIETEAAKQSVAQSRAESYARSATAREEAAQATEAWQRYRETHQPPSDYQLFKMDPEGFRQFEGIKHPQSTHELTGVAAERQWMEQDPEGFARYQTLKKKPEKTTEEEKEMIEFRARMEAKYRRPPQPQRPIKHTVQDEQRAEDQALEQLLRTNPEYQIFTERLRQKGDSVFKNTGAMVPKNLGTVLNSVTIGSNQELRESSMFGPAISDTTRSLVRDHYKNFLSDLDKKKQVILANTAGQEEWTIIPEKEEQ